MQKQKHDQGRLLGCARDLSSPDENCQDALRTAPARITVNGVHAGRSRADQKNGSMTGEATAAWLRLTRNRGDPARS